jgi:hypothetical protein
VAVCGAMLGMRANGSGTVRRMGRWIVSVVIVDDSWAHGGVRCGVRGVDETG